MKTYRVEFYIKVPDEATDADVEALMRFELGVSGTLRGGNPLAKHDLQDYEVCAVSAREE